MLALMYATPGRPQKKVHKKQLLYSHQVCAVESVIC